MQPLCPSFRLNMQHFLRRLVCCLAATIAVSGCGKCDTAEDDRAKLHGKWEVVSCENVGISIPADVGEQYEFAGDKFRTISTLKRVSPWITFSLNVTASPKHIDWPVKVVMSDKTVKEQTEKRIYRLNGNKLQIAYLTVLTPTVRRPIDFSARHGCWILTLRRIPLADPAEEQKRQEAAAVRDQMLALGRLHEVVSATKEHGKFRVDFHGATDRNGHCVTLPYSNVVADSQWQDLLTLRDIGALGFRGCIGVGDTQMQHVSRLVSIESLNLHSTDVTDAGIAQLKGLSHLESLDLSFTPISDEAVPAISKLPRLKKLTLRGSLITANGIEQLRRARPNVEVVWRRPYTETQQKAASGLSQLRLEVDEDIDRELKPRTIVCQVTFPPRIKVQDPSLAAPSSGESPGVDFGRGYLAKIDPAVVAGLLEKLPAPNVVIVELDTMDDSIFVCLRRAEGLQRLHLRATRITDTGLAGLTRHKNLRVLDISHCKKITDSGVAHLASLNNLQTLNLSGVNVTPDGLETLLQLRGLKTLRIDRKSLRFDFIAKFRQNGVDLRLE
jgi:uncharacterized protein (TIGR03067 family)